MKLDQKSKSQRPIFNPVPHGQQDPPHIRANNPRSCPSDFVFKKSKCFTNHFLFSWPELSTALNVFLDNVPLFWNIREMPCFGLVLVECFTYRFDRRNVTVVDMQRSFPSAPLLLCKSQKSLFVCLSVFISFARANAFCPCLTPHNRRGLEQTAAAEAKSSW